MPLTVGVRLGAYEIVSALGAGGMGEVYRAKDTKLGRDVAVKILPQEVAHDPDRVARFQREAQLLAALNHPHIAAIHGLEEADGCTFLVLEYVDGESLADRLTQVGRVLLDPPRVAGSDGPGLHLDEALRIARQIVDALEAAHEKGIIHRDLKPANIMLTADGQVKVLDFGLAKALESPATASSGPAVPGLTHSPTISMAATAAGMILGTAAYMSPEQAKGRPADKRTDVWAFGCVLYEMLTGRRAFDGEDATEVIAAVVRAEPDWRSIPATVGPQIRNIVTRCLVKDRKHRIPDISVVRFMLDEVASGAASVDAGVVAIEHTSGTARYWIAATAALAATTLAALALWYSSRPEAPRVSRFSILPPDQTSFIVNRVPATSAAISPDGRRIAFTARDDSGKTLIWIRAIDSLIAQPLPGTDDAAYPFWSPDNRFIGYSTRARLMRVDSNGGPPMTLCPFSGAGIIGRGGTWNADGVIVFNNGPGPLHRVSSAGGPPLPIMALPSGQSAQTFPAFLPGGKSVLFYVDAGSPEVAGVYVSFLDGSAPKRLVGAESGAVYDSRSGLLLYIRQGTLLGHPFDPDRLTFTGDPFPVAERVESATIPGIITFSVSENGILAYGTTTATASGDLQMAWVDRQGKQLATLGPPGTYRGIDLSPDGNRVAAHRHDLTGGDVWISDASGRTARLTFDVTQDNSSPIWSPDGTRIAFASLRGGKWQLYEKAANNSGGETQLAESDRAIEPTGWSRDGQTIVYDAVDAKTLNDIWLYSLPDRKSRPIVNTTASQSHGQISPDGKWLAYQSLETGRYEVYVQPFPSGAGRSQLSTEGGQWPRWRRDGRELFYISQNSNKMMAVDITSNASTFEPGTPKELFDSGFFNNPHNANASRYNAYAVSPDGQRFLIPRTPARAQIAVAPIAVVENWAEGLKK